MTGRGRAAPGAAAGGPAAVRLGSRSATTPRARRPRSSACPGGERRLRKPQRGGRRDHARGGGARHPEPQEQPFGPGWWLAGLEQLLLDPRGNPALRVGGDGSMRRYAAVPGTTDRWAAASIDRPDTLVRDGTGFARLLPGGARALRRPRAARGHAQPPGAGDELRLHCRGAAGQRERPARGLGPVLHLCLRCGRPPGTRRRTRRAGSGRASPQRAPRAERLATSITDPDNHQVVFTHADGTGRRIVARRDRRGHTTLFRYDAGGKIAASRLDLENGTAS